MRPTRSHVTAVLTALVVCTAAVPSGAQTRIDRCVQDERGRPVADARALAPDGTVLGYSDADGRFAPIEGRAIGRVERIGFRPLVVGQDAVLTADSCLMLQRIARALPAVVVADARTPALGQSITRATAQRAPALAEPDVFRSLPLAGGVTQTNDLRASVHLGGGATDETGVTLDGHPLQWPFHANSAVSAFNVGALERVDVDIHRLSPAENDWLAGRIALVPRSATSAGGQVDASLLAAAATAFVPTWPGVGLLVSGRHTFLSGLVDRISASQDNAIPTYRDALVRVSSGDSLGWSGSVLGYATADVRRPRVRTGDETRWGEALVGAHGRYASARLQLQVRLSSDRAALRDVQQARALPPPAGSVRPTSPDERLHVALTQRWSSGTLAGTWRGADGARAMVGAGVDARTNEWDWNTTASRMLLAPQAPFIVASARTQTRRSLFGEVSHRLGGGVLTVGTRTTRLLDRLFNAPRIMFEVDDVHGVDVAVVAERRYQYDAVPEELNAGELLPPVALLDVPRRVDVVAVSGAYHLERRTDRRSGLRASLFRRRYVDRPTLAGGDPVAADDRWPYAQLVRAAGHAAGASVTGEHVRAGGLAVQATYTLQRVREVVAGAERPTAWDAPHTLNVVAGVPLGARWSGTVVGQFHSGAATTPAEVRVLVPGITSAPIYSGRLLYGAPNSVRLPSYHRIDLGVRRAWTGGRVEWAFTAQAINVLARRNLLTYDWESNLSCAAIQSCAPTGDRSLPLVPSLGLQVKW